MKRRIEELILLAVSAACLVFIFLDSSRFFLRLDLTRSRANTLSAVTRRILGGLPDQLQITYYLSDTLRSLSPASGRVIDLLQEYAAAGRGRLSVSVFDPERTGLTDSARRFGVLPQQIQVFQANEQRTVDVFSGIVLEYLNRYTTLPAVFTPDGLEFNLSLSIRKLLAGRRIQVGVLLGRPDTSLARNFDNLQTGLSRDYAVRELLPGEPIPPEVDALLVLDGLGLGNDALRPIDRYLMEGGRILFAVKGLRVETVRRLAAEAAGPSPLLDLIASYGVRVDREMALDTACRDYRLPQESGGQIVWEKLGSYPPWVSIRSPDVSAANPITSDFSGLDLLWPSPLEALPVEGVQAEALVKTTSSAWTMGEPFVIDPFRVPRSGGEGGRQLVLAYALTGRFPSRFAPGPGEASRSLPARIVVVGDDDFASDLMTFSDSLYNVFFIQNAVLWLAGQEDLLSIKTRAPGEGRLDRIADPALKTRIMLAAEAVNVGLVPALVILLGVLRLLGRRERERRPARRGRS
jgi:ABC-type uncharacterized transport system involved in gliding motility auxiliary subunit